MSYDNIIDDGGAPVRTVTVNRPAVLNALNVRTLEELDACFAALDAPAGASLRCVILTGAGEKAFVAGADIAAMERLGVEEARRFADCSGGVWASGSRRWPCR